MRAFLQKLLPLLLVAGCVTSSGQKADTLASDALEQVLAQEGLGKKTVVIRQQTMPVTKKKSMTFPQKAAELRERLPGVTDELFEAFRKANKAAAQLDPKAFKRKVAAGGWGELRRKHPKAAAFIGLSRAGVDKDGETALLYYTITIVGKGEFDEGAGGSGGFVLLRRDGDRWKLVKTATQWTS